MEVVMNQTNIFSRILCVVMFLSSLGMVNGQTQLPSGGDLDSKSYVLNNSNLTITKAIVVPSGVVATIDLNGYVLKGSNIDYVIHVKSGGKLTIKDSDPTLGHAGYLTDEGLYAWPDVAGKPDLNIPGGIIYNQRVEGKNTRGIYVEGECIIQGGKILGCYSSGHGGGIMIASSGKLTMTGGTVGYNYAATRGGGIYGQPAGTGTNGAVIELSNTIVTHNLAGTHGAGIYGDDITLNGCTIEYNDTPEYGGGIYTDYAAGSKLAINNSTIQYNRAGIRGGGVYSSTESNVKNTTIEGNWAATSETGSVNKGRGGGFVFTKSSAVAEQTAILENTVVKNNVCMYYGGGGEVLNGAHLKMENGSQINNNEVLLHGAGGLHVSSSAKFTLEGGEIVGNKAVSVGGGIHSSYECELTLTGGRIHGNEVWGRGAGVHVNTGGSLTLQGTNITENKAYEGVKYVTCLIEKGTNGQYRMLSRTSVVEEKTGYGGGVLIDAGTCTMTKGQLTGNYAEVGGGGIGLVMINMNMDVADAHFKNLKVVKFTLDPAEGSNVVVQNNTTDGAGAGIYLMENTMAPKLTDKSSSDPVIQAQINVIKKGIPEAIIKGGTLTGNVANGNGGALLVNGNVTMTDGIFQQNRAANGGGICVLGGTVSITKGTVSKNTATQFGGGIYVANTDANAVITIAGQGIFEENDAFAGGGMAVNGPFTFNFQGSLQNNTAKNGGGIYLMPGKDGANGAKLNFKGGFIRNNKAVATSALAGNTAKHAVVTDENGVTGVGGGVFLADKTQMYFNVAANADLGFYGNRADNAGDDIFANGNGTVVALPNVTTMKLKEFPVPAVNLFWAEDFFSFKQDNGTYLHDTQYQSLISPAPTFHNPNHNLRYDYALKNICRSHIIQVPPITFSSRYVCLTLGYQIFFATIKKTGLKVGESALFKIETDLDHVQKPYITMLLTGTHDDGRTVTKRVALPEGYWKIVEDATWGWTYNLTNQGNNVDPSKVKDGFYLIDNDEIIFEFTNEKKEVDALLYDEAIKVNEMGKTSNSSGDK